MTKNPPIRDVESRYQEWKKQVDDEIFRLVGLTSDGMPDFDYRFAFSCGISAKGTAKKAVNAARNF